MGNVQVVHAFNPNDCSCGTTPIPGLEYNASSIDVHSVLQAFWHPSDLQPPDMPFPDEYRIDWTWDGGAQTTRTFAAPAGADPTDRLTAAFRTDQEVTRTGWHDYDVTVTARYQGTTLWQTDFSGAVIAEASDSGDPFTAGWQNGISDRLVPVGADPAQNKPGGMLREYGIGGWRFYEDDGSGGYNSPGGDNGFLGQMAGGGGYSYTTPDGSRTTFDSAGREVAWVAPNGFDFRDFSYNADGTLSHETDSDGRVTQYAYGNGGAISDIDYGTRHFHFQVGAAGTLDEIDDPDGGVRSFTYNSAGKMTSDNFGGIVTGWSYDNWGESTAKTWGANPAAPQVTGPANERGKDVLWVGPVNATVTDELGRTTTYVRDLEGRIQSETTPDGATTLWGYDANLYVAGFVDPLGRETDFTNDAVGYVTAEVFPDGSTRTYVYQQSHHALTSMTDENGHTTSFTYDIHGDPLSVTDAAGHLTTMTWSEGLPTTVNDALGRTTTMTWGSNRQLATETDSAGGQYSFQYNTDLNQTTITDPLGRVTQLGYDGMGRVNQRTDALGNVWTSSYIAAGALASETDPRGTQTTVTYDSRGLATNMTEGSRTWVTTYDGAGQATGYTDAMGHVYTVSYDLAGRPASVTDPLGHTSTVAYDLAGETTSYHDALGRVTQYQYTPRGWTSQITEAAGTADQRITQLFYDGVGNVTRTIDPRGIESRADYDVLDQLTSVTEAYGLPEQRTSSFQYNVVGDMTATTDPNGNVWHVGYDALDRATSATDPLGHVWTAAYNAVGDMTGVTNPLGATWQVSYDALDRPTQLTDPLGGISLASYDSTGNVTSVTDANGHTTNAAYDLYGRVTTVTQAVGTPVQRSFGVQYDNNDNVTSYTDPNGHVWTATYSAINELTGWTNPLGNTWTVGYDSVGNVTSQSDPLGHTWTVGYDNLDRPTIETNPLGYSTTVSYDQNDNVASLTDADGNTTTWQYDGLNRVVQDTNQLGYSRSYVWDANNNLTQETDRNGRTRQFVYNPLNQLTSETWVGGNYSQNRSYDAAGNLTSISDPYSSYQYGYDLLGRVISIDNAGTPNQPHIVQTQTFDPAGNRTSLSATVNGSADFVNNYQFDALNRMTQVTQSGNGVAEKRVDMTYTPTDQFATINRYSELAGTQLVVSSTYGYDAADELTSLDHKRADNSTIAHYGYQYNAAGWMTQMVSPDGTANYQYDAAGQITDATYSFQPNEHFAWDPNGNPTGAGYVIGADNRLLSDGVNNYQYDHEGNRISQTNIATGAVVNYAWDYRNRLVDVNQQDGQGNTIMDEANVYDAFDRRIGKSLTANGSTVSQQFAYNGLGVIDAFQSGSLTNRYLQGPGLDNVFADEQVQPGSGSNTLWTLGDHLGSVRDVVDNSGVVQKHAAYSAFGQRTIDTNPALKENFAFAAGFTDQEFGLMNHWAGWENGATANWMNQNPIGFRAGDANLTRYAFNRPTTSSGTLKAQASGSGGTLIVMSTPDDTNRLIDEAIATLRKLQQQIRSAIGMGPNSSMGGCMCCHKANNFGWGWSGTYEEQQLREIEEQIRELSKLRVGDPRFPQGLRQIGDQQIDLGIAVGATVVGVGVAGAGAGATLGLPAIGGAGISIGGGVAGVIIDGTVITVGVGGVAGTIGAGIAGIGTIGIGISIVHLGGTPAGPGEEIHHIASNKGAWREKFKKMFDDVGLDIDKDACNKMPLYGHHGRHIEEYHEWVYRRLTEAIGTKTGKEAQEALLAELYRIRALLIKNPRLPYADGGLRW